jgi:3-hydroxyacyl-CoA dehydrogenase
MSNLALLLHTCDMHNTSPPSIAVVGTGIIGRSWMLLFARAGCMTRAYDASLPQLTAALRWMRQELETDVGDGFITPTEAAQCSARVTACDDLASAIGTATYVQESGPESIDVKRALYAALDQHAAPAAILASSTSTHDMTTIADGLEGAWRCIVAHPVNPPHVVPLVEVLAGARTNPDVVDRTVAFLESVGQTPVLLKRYAPGFLLNRMQAALIREAVCLVESGVADVDAVDAVIRDGLGLRWGLLGPFGVANTNADGGIREYLQHYGGALRSLMDDLGGTPALDPAMIARLGEQTDSMEGDVPLQDILRWRDRSIRGWRRLKQEDPHPNAASSA